MEDGAAGQSGTWLSLYVEQDRTPRGLHEKAE